VETEQVVTTKEKMRTASPGCTILCCGLRNRIRCYRLLTTDQGLRTMDYQVALRPQRTPRETESA